MKRTLARRKIRILLFALMLIGVVLAAAFLTLENFNRSRQWVEHSYVVRGTLNRIVELLIDSEANERGYLLTGSPSYLNAFTRVEERLQVEWSKVHQLVRDNAVQVKSSNQLKTALDMRRATLQSALYLWQSKNKRINPDPILPNLQRANEQFAMARKLTGQMRHEEVRLLRMRSDRVEKMSRLYRLVTAFIIGGLFLTIWLLSRIDRDIAQREVLALALKQSESRLRRIAESGMLGVFYWNIDGSITEANDTFLSMLGYSHADVERGDLNFIDITPANQRDKTARKLEEIRRRGFFPPFEKEYQHKDGHCVPIILGGALFEGSHDKGIAVTIDISERRRLETDRERTNRFREEFLGVLGHDLRNPLSSVAMAANLLERRGDLKPAQKKTVERIARSADRMRRMIDQLLDLTRSRIGGGISVQRQFVDLDELTQSVVDELECLYPSKEVRVTSHGDVSGDFDPDRMAQVLSNLIGNALQYGEPNTPVSIELEGRTPQVKVSIMNRGRPIEPELVDSIFDPFRRGYHTKRGPSSGLGLGLFISEQIIRAHEGSIGVTSSEEHGTVFMFTLQRRVAVKRTSTALSADSVYV